MTVAVVRGALLWCFIINMGLMMLWFLMFKFAHDWIYRTHGQWFKFSVEQFDTIHYAGMAFFKTCVIVFNLVPFIALCIVG